MAGQLDPKRAHGVVYGAEGSDITHRYEQDGKKFDAAGNEIVDKGAAKSTPKPQSTAKADAPATAQLDEQLKG